MGSNKVVINGSEELTFEVPNSFMLPLMAYLEMVKEKTVNLEGKDEWKPAAKQECE